MTAYETPNIIMVATVSVLPSKAQDTMYQNENVFNSFIFAPLYYTYRLIF